MSSLYVAPGEGPGEYVIQTTAPVGRFRTERWYLPTTPPGGDVKVSLGEDLHPMVGAIYERLVPLDPSSAYEALLVVGALHLHATADLDKLWWGSEPDPEALTDDRPRYPSLFTTSKALWGMCGVGEHTVDDYARLVSAVEAGMVERV